MEIKFQAPHAIDATSTQVHDGRVERQGRYICGAVDAPRATGERRPQGPRHRRRDAELQLHGLRRLGEMSADQIKDLGCEWVILGHSERRGEVPAQRVLKTKLQYVLDQGLSAVFCIGEPLPIREKGIGPVLASSPRSSSTSSVSCPRGQVRVVTRLGHRDRRRGDCGPRDPWKHLQGSHPTLEEYVYEKTAHAIRIRIARDRSRLPGHGTQHPFRRGRASLLPRPRRSRLGIV